MRVREYPEIDYWAIELESGELLPDIASKYVRISVPSGEYDCRAFVDDGYVMVDRTIEVKVPVARSKVDFARYCRMQVPLLAENKDVIRDIARKNFGLDHRFQVTFDENREAVAHHIMDAWIEEQNEIFQCRYKDMTVGYADVRELEECGNLPFIYMAAVEEKYRAAGAAMSLYASVFKHYQEQGVSHVYGRISSRNMAVMNLYATFGAQYANPYDIYIRK